MFLCANYEDLPYYSDFDLIKNSLHIVSNADPSTEIYQNAMQYLVYIKREIEHNMWIYSRFFRDCDMWPFTIASKKTKSELKWVYSIFEDMEIYYTQVEKEIEAGTPPNDFSPFVKFILEDVFPEDTLTQARDVAWDPAVMGYDNVPVLTAQDFATREGYEHMVNTYIKNPWLRKFALKLKSPYDDTNDNMWRI